MARQNHTTRRAPSQQRLSITRYLAFFSLVIFLVVFTFKRAPASSSSKITAPYKRTKNHGQGGLNFHTTVANGLGKDSWEKGKTCSPSTLASNSRAFKPKTSNCPTRTFMSTLIDSLDPRKPITHVFVGCNKGDDMVLSARLFTGDERFSTTKYSEAVRNNLGGSKQKVVTGPCDTQEITDEMLPVPLHPGESREFVSYCFEPMLGNVEILERSLTEVNLRSDFTVVRAAVSSRSGKVVFKEGIPGQENIGIGGRVNDNLDNNNDNEVDVITLDEYLLPKGHATIEYLSIDTEGNDARVLYGSVKMLATTHVRYLEFEYNSVGQWLNSDLQDVVDLLDNFGFDCYWLGNKGELWRLTGCWADNYYRRVWSNVGCVNRQEAVLWEEMERVSENR